MKRQIPILLWTVLLLVFSGCSEKNYTLGGLGLPSFTQKVLDKKLPTVQGLNVKVGLSKVGLEWTPITNKEIAGYRIFRGDREHGYRLIATLSDRYRSHYTDKDLNPNESYNYKISCYTKDGRVSLASSSKRIRATRSQLPPPIILEASENLPNRIKLLWKIHKNKEVNAYIVERLSLSEKVYERIATLDDRLTVEYIDKEIIPAQKYKYRIRAKTYDDVISPPSNTVTGFSKQLPNAIKWVKVTDNLPRRIDIIWKDTNPPEKIDHYNIYASPMKNTLYSLHGSTKDMKFTDKFDRDGETRYYKITAVDIDGLESTMGIIPTEGMTIGASNGPVINSATVRHNAVFLEWSDPDGKARSYTVVKKYLDGWRARKIKITDFKAKKFTDTKIKPNVQYTYYVISVDKHGIESMPSREVTLSVNSKLQR
jgi:fibronectin type 3 domain-containing protein